MIKSLLMQSVILSRTVKIITYFSPITLIIFVSVVGLFIIYNKRRARMVNLINKIPGPPALPFIGNTVEINVDHDGTVNFNGYSSCIKCTVVGDYDRRGRHMSFPRINCPKRTDQSFRSQSDPDHHREETPLLRLPIDLVEDIIVSDSLHLLDLELFARITGTRFLWGRRFGISRAWMGSLPYVFISDASKVEIILGSPKHIDKSRDYNFLRPWLGTGLLTSFGQKWHSRRKILTPAFHFKILEDFIDVFQEQSDILVRKLEKEIGKNSFNIFPYITNCTLDIICETAMGRSVYAQEDSDSEYVKAVYDIGEIILNRQSKLWLQYDFIFKFTNYYKQHQIALKILHDFSYRVIRERKAEINKLKMDLNNNHMDGVIDQNNNQNNNNSDINNNPNYNKKNNNDNQNNNNNGNINYNNHYDNNNDNNNTNKNNYNNSNSDSDSSNNNINSNYVGDNNFNQNIKKKYIVQRNNHYDDDVVFGKKKRLAFLDLLIEASRDGEVLSNEDIREEVDTFMFEGHDTTSAAISWSLFLLGSHPEIQDRVLQEIDDILDGDRKRPATMKELMDMKYLECVIKEALRLYPSVPLIARQINEDVNIGQYILPAGTTAMIVTYQLHRDPKVFPKPEQFNPDHFLPENCYGRHPYAYIPFSAGPRNCIGQKFAILEEKSVISTVLRKYRIVSVDRREDLTLLGELILRPKDGLQVKIIPRD